MTFFRNWVLACLFADLIRGLACLVAFPGLAGFAYFVSRVVLPKSGLCLHVIVLLRRRYLTICQVSSPNAFLHSKSVSLYPKSTVPFLGFVLLPVSYFRPAVFSAKQTVSDVGVVKQMWALSRRPLCSLPAPARPSPFSHVGVTTLIGPSWICDSIFEDRAAGRCEAADMGKPATPRLARTIFVRLQR